MLTINQSKVNFLTHLFHLFSIYHVFYLIQVWKDIACTDLSETERSDLSRNSIKLVRDCGQRLRNFEDLILKWFLRRSVLWLVGWNIYFGTLIDRNISRLRVKSRMSVHKMKTIVNQVDPSPLSSSFKGDPPKFLLNLPFRWSTCEVVNVTPKLLSQRRMNLSFWLLSSCKWVRVAN